MIPLLNNTYVNGVTLREQNQSLKSCQSYESKVYFRSVLDLSKEVLWVSVYQRVAKLLAVKFGGLSGHYRQSVIIVL